MNTQDLKDLLKRHRLSPNFTFGQNFLIDDTVTEDILDAAKLSLNDAVLEIGPGVGNLTKNLCEKAGFVLSVEKDPKFFSILKSIKKENKNFWFEIADILEFNYLAQFEKLNIKYNLNFRPFALSYKVVANIPYYITGKILRMFFSAKIKPQSIIILTQKEVAQNIVAKKGKLSVLAISVQIFGDPKIISLVPAKSFYPAPKVDSAILKIDLFKKPKYKIEDEKKFFKIVKACFAGKRKQIHNTLTNNLQLNKERVASILSDLKINFAARPQELSIEDWTTLASKITFDKHVKGDL